MSAVLAAVAGPASAAPSGAIGVWVTPNANGGGGKVVLTGAIADYGTLKPATSSGATSKNTNSNYKLLVLSKGTILVNGSQLNQAANNVQPTVNTTNCSLSASVSAPVQIVSGTGAYSGVTGTVNLTEVFAGIAPRKANGSCNENANPKPGAQFGSVTRLGTVS